jgi:L-histidine Nalpha-methyltransferase
MPEATILLDAATSKFAGDVHDALRRQPRRLPSQYLYDPVGSALFEAIGRLPWYHIARAELALLTAHAGDIFNRTSRLARVVALGPGSGQKPAALLARGLDAGKVEPPLEVHLVDVSDAALSASAGVVGAIPGVEVFAHRQPYENGLDALVSVRVGQTLILHLGSTIGNYDRQSSVEMLRGLRRSLAGGDLLLIGADLVKPERDMLLAYDDPLGIGRAFNRNLLLRINTELGGNFDVTRYAHRAVWNGDERRIELHLVSNGAQRVRVPAADVDIALDDGETIWTASSYKFEPADIVDQMRDAGFELADQWVERESGFALTLARADAVSV